MKRKVFLTIALLCAVVQGAWADKWDGQTSEQPLIIDGSYVINSASKLAWVRQNFSTYKSANISLKADIDMGDTSWMPLGNAGGSITEYTGTFNGNGHTIRINISGATDNFQGLFGCIGEGGKVKGLRVSGNIHCSKSRLVGGIAGENNGTIEDCWVSADVSSDWHESGSFYDAKVGGITGENSGTVQYCCVTGNVHNDDADVGAIVGCNNSSGTVSHCTFYGNLSTTHSQDNLYVGDSDGTLNNQHSDDLLTDGTLNTYLASFSDHDFYREAVQRPYAISINDEDQNPSAIEPSATASRSGQTITLTVKPTTGIMLRDVTVKDADGNAISATGNTTDGYTFTMPKRDVNIKVSYIFGGGYGTGKNPYLIKTAEHWNQLVADVANGNIYREDYFRLESDISVTTMVGTSVRSFEGYFDGNGKTLTVNYNTTADGTAPFRYAACPEIRNLHVAGTITTSAKYAAGIVAYSTGYPDKYYSHELVYITRSIINCRSSVTITSSVNGTGYHGGLVGRNDQCNLNIEGCIFDGQMLGKSTHDCGGFVGANFRVEGGAVNTSQCLFAPTVVEWYKMDNFTYGGGSISNSYCLTYNKDIYSITNDGNVTVVNDCDAPKTYSVSGLEFYDKGMKYQGVLYAKSGDAVNLKLTHTGTAPEGKALTGYSASEGTLTAKVANGEYVLTMPGSNVIISAVYEDASMLWSGEGTGEASAPYVIDTPARWDEFAEKVNAGRGNGRFAVAYYKLGTDIAVSTMVGTADHKFSGHFDGDGKTLTLSYGTSDAPFSEDYCAPFRYVDGADIHDVIAAGSIYTASKFAAGLVGHSVGNTTIADSRVSVILNSSVNGDGTHGGIAANIHSGKAYITRCAFNGQLLGATTTQCGGLAGWTELEVVDFSNCLFAPASVTVGSDGSATFARSQINHFNGNYSYFANNGCCYTTALGDSQNGKQVYAERLADTPCKEYEVAGVKYYSAETIVSNVAATNISPNSATISWKSTAEEYTYQVRYRKSQTKYSTSFEDNESLKGWTFIDADGDGSGWGNHFDNSARTGTGVMVSESIDYIYDQEPISLAPDNWLVSPQLSLAGKLSVWLRGYGDRYQEHFAIYLSTTGKFIDDDGKPLAGLVTLVPETVTTNEYKEYTANLSNYKGKQGYIAIRHFNCTGQYILMLDDFSITDESIDDTETVVNADINGVTLTGLEPLTTYEYEVAYTVDNTTYYTPTATLTTLNKDIYLADDADNSSVIESSSEGGTYDVTLSGRTLYRDGSWNTLCLPFDLELAGSPLEGATVKTLSSSSFSGGTLTLNFTIGSMTKLIAGVPYIVKWATTGDDIKEPVFKDVTIRNYLNPVYTGYVEFSGSFSPGFLPANARDVLYLGAGNTLYYPSDNMTVGSCRAVFVMEDITAGDPTSQLSRIVLDFGDGETTSVNEELRMKSEESAGAAVWYDLQGHRLNGKPSRAGVYINNGKTVVIK